MNNLMVVTNNDKTRTHSIQFTIETKNRNQVRITIELLNSFNKWKEGFLL